MKEAISTLEPLTHNSKELLGSMKLELVFETKKKVGYVLSNDLGENLNLVLIQQRKKYFYIDRTKAGKNDFSEKFAPQLSYAPRFAKEKTIHGTMILDKLPLNYFGIMARL